MTSPCVLLVDGDWALWKISTAAERPVKWHDEIWTLHSDAGEAKDSIRTLLSSLLEKLGAQSLQLAFTDYSRPNWRLNILPSYKAHRKLGRKPVCYWPLRDWLVANYTTLCIPTLEGDDILGLWATDPKVKGKKVVVSHDKDLQSVPGYLFNPDREDEGVRKISREQADRFHLYQTLVGDRVDGYAGCKGIGPVSAERILNAFDGGWAAVQAAYNDAGLTEVDALVQARVARILRHREFNFRTNQVKLWEPALAVH
jgi:DNA polymerase-1